MSDYVTDTHSLIWYLEETAHALALQPEIVLKLVTVENPPSMSRQSAWWRSSIYRKKAVFRLK